MLKSLCVVFISMFLASCSLPDTHTEDLGVVNATILTVKKPKRFRLSLITDSGVVYDNIRVSKRCSNYASCPVNRVLKLNLYEKTRTYKDGRVVVEKHFDSQQIRNICCY